MNTHHCWTMAAAVALSAALGVACDSRVPADTAGRGPEIATETVTLALRGMT